MARHVSREFAAALLAYVDARDRRDVDAMWTEVRLMRHYAFGLNLLVPLVDGCQSEYQQHLRMLGGRAELPEVEPASRVVRERDDA